MVIRDGVYALVTQSPGQPQAERFPCSIIDLIDFSKSKLSEQIAYDRSQPFPLWFVFTRRRGNGGNVGWTLAIQFTSDPLTPAL